MALAVLFLQLFTPGSLAKLIVKENADLQLNELQDNAELVQDITLALQCRRQVKRHTNWKMLSLYNPYNGGKKHPQKLWNGVDIQDVWRAEMSQIEGKIV